MNVVCIGAGPVGLEFCIRAVARGHDVTLIERDVIGANVRRWGHVTFFSPWRLNTSEVGLRVLDEMGVARPDPDGIPSGHDFLESYLNPLAEWLATRATVRTHTEVSHVGRKRLRKGDAPASIARRDDPFRVLIKSRDGREEALTCDAVVDCSGTYGNPNYLGAGGLPAIGERDLYRRITYVIPDALGEDSHIYAHRTTLIVGAGFSAATTLEMLIKLAERYPETRVVWVTRRDDAPYVRVPEDPLPSRDALAALGNAMTKSTEIVRHIGDVSVTELRPVEDDRVRVTLERGSGETLDVVVDRVIANVGYRPDTSIYEELQVHECYASQGPMKIAATLLAASETPADCLAASAAVADTLINPEPNFFILGSKSYGRTTDFLLRVGSEQCELVLTLLAEGGDA